MYSKEILNSTDLSELFDFRLQLLHDREMINIDLNNLFHNGKPTREEVNKLKNKKLIIKSKLKIVEQQIRIIRELENVKYGKYCIELVRRLKYKFPEIHKELDYESNR